MQRLQGKIAVITGSTRGLGLATARAFVREGARVVCSSRSAQAVEATVSELKAQGAECTGLACDVSDLEQVRRLAQYTLDTFGRIDIWVNNAGMAGPYGPLVEMQPERFRRVLETNIFGTYYGSLVALRYFLPQKTGKLINILGRGEESPAPMQISYGSSKAWSRSFTLALAKENAGSGVGIFAFSPGLMVTDFLSKVDVIEGHEARLKVFPAVVRWLGKPPEVPAERLVWLASSATDGRTGMLVRESNPLRLLGGALTEALHSMAGKPTPPMELDIHPVPSDFHQ